MIDVWVSEVSETDARELLCEDFAAPVSAECYSSHPMDSLKETSETTRSGVIPNWLFNTLSTILGPFLLVEDS